MMVETSSFGVLSCGRRGRMGLITVRFLIKPPPLPNIKFYFTNISNAFFCKNWFTPMTLILNRSSALPMHTHHCGSNSFLTSHSVMRILLNFHRNIKIQRKTKIFRQNKTTMTQQELSQDKTYSEDIPKHGAN